MQRILAVVLVASLVSLFSVPARADDQAEREKQFAEMMTNAQLIGYYTSWGKEGEPKRDTYTIEKVVKLADDRWQFVARIQYGGKDQRAAMALPVKWAGDSPVIYLEKTPIPGFGEFSARIIFHGHRYGGTWDGGDHGGHMYGEVKKLEAKE